MKKIRHKVLHSAWATDKKFWRRQNEERQTTFYNTISKARCRAQGLCSVLWNDRPGKGPEEERVCVRAPLNDGSTPGPDTTLPTKHTPRPKRITPKTHTKKESDRKRRRLCLGSGVGVAPGTGPSAKGHEGSFGVKERLTPRLQRWFCARTRLSQKSSNHTFETGASAEAQNPGPDDRTAARRLPPAHTRQPQVLP